MSLFSLISVLISLAAVSGYVNYRYVKLPTTVGVMLVALVASLALVLVGPYAGGFREQAAAMVSRIDFDQVVLHGMLAFLLFAAAIHVNLDKRPCFRLNRILGTHTPLLRGGCLTVSGNDSASAPSAGRPPRDHPARVR